MVLSDLIPTAPPAPSNASDGMGSTFAELLLDKLWEWAPVKELEVFGSLHNFHGKLFR
jgi:hypothetical protein